MCSELLGIAGFARSEITFQARSARIAGCDMELSCSRRIAFAVVAVSAKDRVCFRTGVLGGSADY